MSSTSIASLSSHSSVFPQLDYNFFNNTVQFCSHIRLQAARNTPLDCCLRMIWERHLGVGALPTSKIETWNMPELSQSCKITLWNHLNTSISLSHHLVTPIKWLRNLVIISQGQKHLWNYQDTILTGSALPMTAEYWDLYLNKFRNLEPQLHNDFRQKLTPSKEPWKNLDALIRVQLGAAADAKDEFEAAVLRALHLLVKDKMTTKEISFATKRTHIGELGTVFTIGDETRSFDLMVWYPPEEQGLPELFTQQGLYLRIHHLLGRNLKDWPSIRAETTGISPSILLADRCINSVRFHPHTFIGVVGNFGIFKKLMVMKTKGSLGPQSGLEAWALRIYQQVRQKPKFTLNDALQSYREHLPKTLGTLIAHFLHWMIVVRKAKDNPAQLALAGGLTYPIDDLTPEYLLQTYLFIKNYPDKFSLLVNLIEFCQLLSYLQKPEQTVTFGIWEGLLTMRVSLDGSSNSFFQRQLNPRKNFAKLIHLLNTSSAESCAAAKRLFQSYFIHFQLQNKFLFDQKAEKLLAHVGVEQEKIQTLFDLLHAPATDSAPSNQLNTEEIMEISLKVNLEDWQEVIIHETVKKNMATTLDEVIVEEKWDYTPIEKPQTAPTSNRMSISWLIQNKKWRQLAQRLFSATTRIIPEQKRETFGNYIWKLFEGWVTQGQEGKQPAEVGQYLLDLLKNYSKVLELTKTLKRSHLLRDLITLFFQKERQLEILLQHEEKQFNVMSPEDIQGLLLPQIPNCLDGPHLLRLHSVFKAPVQEHILKQLSLRPAPQPGPLSRLIQFFRLNCPEQFATIEASIAQQLVSELRGPELSQYGFSIDCNNLFQASYDNLLQERDFNKANTLLGQWKVYSKLPLEDQELELLERGKNLTSSLNTIHKAIQLWDKHQKQQDNIAQRSFSLCLDLAIKPQKIDSNLMKNLWDILKGYGSKELADLSISGWTALLANLRCNDNFSELWEALDRMLHQKNHWDSQLEDVFISMLQRSIKSRGKKGVKARTNLLLPILSRLEGRVKWDKHLDRTNGISMLVILNLAAIIKTHPDPEQRTIARDTGKAIIKQIKSANLNSYEQNTVLIAKQELNGRLQAIVNQDPVPILRNNIAQRNRQLHMFRMIRNSLVVAFVYLIGRFVYMVYPILFNEPRQELPPGVPMPAPMLAPNGETLIQGPLPGRVMVVHIDEDDFECPPGHLGGLCRLVGGNA